MSDSVLMEGATPGAAVSTVVRTFDMYSCTLLIHVQFCKERICIYENTFVLGSYVNE